MKSPLLVIVVALGATCLMTTDTWSRGGRGGGGARGGGGRAMSRGGMGGGYSRTPSMSRAQSRPSMPTRRPATSRPATSRPNLGSRPSVSRPNVGGAVGNRPNVGRPSTGMNRPNVTRPNLGNSRPGATRPSVSRPNASRPNANRPNASRPNVSRPGTGGRPSAGDLGNFLKLPGGNRPTTLPGRQPGTGNRPNLGNRPGVGDRPNVGNRPNLGERPNFGNRPNIGNRPNVGNRPNIGNKTNINVGNNNRVNVSRNRQRNVNSIRNHWSNVGRRPFGRNWWGRYPATRPGWGWHGGWGRYPGSWYWRHGTWAAYGTWFAWRWADPVVYDYGTNVVYRDNYVYVDNKQVATTADYYQQAEAIAESIPEAMDVEQVEWMPLGVFAIAEEDGVDNGMLIQLAVSKEGIIAGTFYNDATDEGRPLEGQVDRETQRAAWKFADGKNSEIVMETGVYNLTQEESTALVHFGADKTQTWLMVRLPEDEDAEKE